MKILNLYAGIGGNRKLWGDEHEITSVEYVPHIAATYAKLFPQDTLVIGDAHQYLLDHFKEFDFIWTSPPCPTHSRLVTAKQGWGLFEYPDMALYQEIIFLQHFFTGKYVVENVISYYDPLIKPMAELARHYFWTNFNLAPFYSDIKFDVIRSDVKKMQQMYGIELPEGTKDARKLLRNAVIPDLGLHILNQLEGVSRPQTSLLPLFEKEAQS